MDTQRIINCIPSKDKQDDWQIEKAQAMGYLPQKIELPEKVDLAFKEAYGIVE